MAVKYIQKNKKGKWQISSSIHGRASRVFTTQKSAIQEAAKQKNTTSFMIKREQDNLWREPSYWDLRLFNEVKQELGWANSKTKKPPIKKIDKKNEENDLTKELKLELLEQKNQQQKILEQLSAMNEKHATQEISISKKETNEFLINESKNVDFSKTHEVIIPTKRDNSFNPKNSFNAPIPELIDSAGMTNNVHSTMNDGINDFSHNSRNGKMNRTQTILVPTNESRNSFTQNLPIPEQQAFAPVSSMNQQYANPQQMQNFSSNNFMGGQANSKQQTSYMSMSATNKMNKRNIFNDTNVFPSSQMMSTRRNKNDNMGQTTPNNLEFQPTGIVDFYKALSIFMSIALIFIAGAILFLLEWFA